MIALRVRYTVKPTYVEHNKENIQQVMNDLKALGNPNTKYMSFLEEDGKTFMHFAMYPDQETADLLNTLSSFAKFRKELKESEPEIAPQLENLSMVGAGYNVFN